jgi:hypothetical protein
MQTFKYKNGYIHENFTTGEVVAQLSNNKLIKCKSVNAAKLIITRLSK